MTLLSLVAAHIYALTKYEGVRRRNVHSREIRDGYTGLLMGLVDAETGQRGFLLTGNPDYLAPFHDSGTAIQGALDDLERISGDEAGRSRLESLRTLTRHKLTELNHTVELARKGKVQEALTRIETGDGKATMDEVRARVNQILAAEEAEIERRGNKLHRELNVLLGIDAAAGLALVILGFLLRAIDRDLRRRAELELELRQAAEQVSLQNRELAIGRERYETTLRAIGDAVIATDRLGNITFLNPIASALTGWSPKDAEGLPLPKVFVIVHETSRKPVASPVDRVLQEGVVVGLANHTVLLRRDGSELAIDDSAAPIFDRDRQLAGVVLVFRDVSRRRRDEAAQNFLLEASSQLNATLDFQTTLANVAKSAVPAVADWCAVDLLVDGKRRRVAVAHTDPSRLELVRDLERRYPPDPQSPRGVPHILRTGEPEIISDIPRELVESSARDPEHLALLGKLRLRSYMGVPIKRGRKTIGVITFATAESGRRYDLGDLGVALALADRASVAVENARLFSELQQAQKEAEAQKRQAEVANRSKDDFLAILGHELRNPLAPILTALQLMQLRAGDVLGRERTIIERQVKHVVRLVDDLLDISRITGGKVELAREPVEIAEVVAKAIEMSSPLLEQRQHDVTLAVESDLFVNGDMTRLSQVVANLLNNAAKYTEPKGRIHISAVRDGGQVVLRVRDSGMGIAPEMMPRIFDMFVQEQQSLDRAQGGLGLGLAIVRTLVTLHGGVVSAASDGAGKGAELTVRLPALDAPPARTPHLLPAAAPLESPPGACVLVVDDNRDALDLLAEALEGMGYDVLRAGDGPEALKLVQKKRPELALLDIGLPVMDGYELGRRLRDLFDHIRLVALSGYGQESDKARSSAAGFDAHLVKPVSVDVVQTTIEELRA